MAGNFGLASTLLDRDYQEIPEKFSIFLMG